MIRKAGKLSPFNEFKSAFKDAYGEGRNEWSRAYREARKTLGEAEDAPRIDEMTGAYPTLARLKELAQDISGKPPSKEDLRVRVVRDDLGLGPKMGPVARTGQMLGTLAADVTQDNARNFYWLLNAPQATGNVIAEKLMGEANKGKFRGTDKELYGKKPVEGGKYNIRQSNRIPEKYVTQGGERVVPKKGYMFDDDGVLYQRNFNPGDIASLLIPSGIAVNAGLGLLSPFGGTNGLKAAVPSEEDPTKTENVIAEVASKYFLGRTGNLLPYDEFKEIRPDVSKPEYGKYQAFKYDNSLDLNPFDDGQVTAPAGILKYTNEGIFGPEVQFLGRSLPVTTALVPFAGAAIGGALGVRRGRPIKGGLIGGFGGLAAGMAVGNVVENERRRRNQIENEMDYIQT